MWRLPLMQKRMRRERASGSEISQQRWVWIAGRRGPLCLLSRYETLGEVKHSTRSYVAFAVIFLAAYLDVGL